MSNLLPLPRSRFYRGPRVASGGQPLVPSSFPIVVPTPARVVNPSSDEVGSLVLVPSHGCIINEDVVLPLEPLEPTPRMDKGK